MKNSISKLLFGAWALLAAGMFAACVDDNDEDGTPFIEVNPETLVCSLDGKFEGGGNSFEVKSNRPWTLVAETGSEWIEFSPKQGGEGTTKVEVSVPASNEGRVGTLTFQLANTYAVYLTKQVTVQQGEAPVEGPIAKLVAYIKENLASTPSGGVDLNYSESTVEGVILANNQYGNNFGKLYVGDNVTAPNSAIVLHDTGEFTKEKSANYPVGKKVTLDLSGAKYELYNNLRELKNVKITVSEAEAVEVVVPTLTAAQFKTGNYQGQYVKVTGVTPQAEFVGKAWALANERHSVKLGADGVEVQAYMAKASDAPDFAALLIAAKTGAIWGTAEQHYEKIQVIPTKPEDVLELTAGGDEPTVTTGAATAVAATSVTLSGSSRNIDNATEVGIAYKLDNTTEEAPTLVPAKAVAAEWSVDITGLAEGTAYMYYAYAKVGDAEPIRGETKTFTTTTTSPQSIADVIAGGTDKNAFVEGVIVAKHTQGFVLKDNTGLLYVYLRSETSQNIGDKVQVKGTTNVYNGLFQIKDPTVTLVEAGSYEQPTPEQMTGPAIETYLNQESLPIKYVQYKGVLTFNDGKYYNVVIDGTDKQGSIQNPPAGLIDPAIIDAPVVVIGYTVGTDRNKNYFNTMATSVVLDSSASATITEVDPSSLSWANDETAAKTVTVKGVKLTSDNITCALSGAGSSHFTVEKGTPSTASGITTIVLTVTPTAANTGADGITETLTVQVADGNSEEIALEHKGSASDVELYSTGFEKTDRDPSTNNSYTTAHEYTETETGVKWNMMYADIVTTASPITGSFHILGRVAKNTTNSPVIHSTNLLSKEATRISKVAFKAKGNTAHTMKVEYSTNGTDWIASDFNQTLTGTATGYTANINLGTPTSTFMLRFTVSVTSTTTGNRDAYLDDIVVYGL